MTRSNKLKFITLLFIATFIILWLIPPGAVSAQEDEEAFLEELTGEKGVTAEEGKIEVLGISEEQLPFLGDRFLLVVVVLVLAAVGGLVLSFVIKARA